MKQVSQALQGEAFLSHQEGDKTGPSYKALLQHEFMELSRAGNPAVPMKSAANTVLVQSLSRPGVTNPDFFRGVQQPHNCFILALATERGRD